MHETGPIWKVDEVPFHGLREVGWRRVTHLPTGLWGYASHHIPVSEMKDRIMNQVINQPTLSAYEQALWMIATGHAEASDAETVDLMRGIAIEALGEKWREYERACVTVAA